MALIGPGGRPITSTPVENSAAAGASPHIKDSGLATFAADVLEASRQVPVIVDFWAPWCGPCKQLGPSLEKAVQEAKGAVRLVKVNIDENPEIAQQLRIQSIPTVYAFKDGQPVDGFMGALPDSQVQAFVRALASGVAAGDSHGHGGPEHAAEILAIADDALAAGDIGTAAQAYGHVLQDTPGDPKAVAGLAACYLKSGDIERARTTLQLVRPDGANHEAIRAIEAELKLRDNPAPRGEVEVLRARLAADGGDHQARYDLALALDAAGDREAAIAELLELVRRDRKWNEDAARSQLLTMFEAMGPADPRTIEARRKLSGLLFFLMLKGYHSFTDLPGTMPIFPLTGVLLLPRAALPLNVFEPRYLELVDDALRGDRLIGMIQPIESEDTVLRPKLSQVGCAGRVISWRETDDNRYLITLAGLCRFRVKEEISALSAYRQVACDFASFAGDLAQGNEDGDFPRERLLSALKDYLSRRDMKADWKSVMTAPAESLVNALAMMCPFEPAEKQALLEAPSWTERVSTLVALLEISTVGQGPRDIELMETDPKLLEILVCPVTRTTLHYDRDQQELVSRAAGLAFPIRGGVPIMLESEARTLSDDERK